MIRPTRFSASSFPVSFYLLLEKLQYCTIIVYFILFICCLFFRIVTWGEINKRKELQRWNKKRFSSFLKDFLSLFTVIRGNLEKGLFFVVVVVLKRQGKLKITLKVREKSGKKMISGKIWDLPHTENCHILAIEFFLVTPLFENFSILNFQFQCPSSLLIDFSVWDFLSLTLSQYIKS